MDVSAAGNPNTLQQSLNPMGLFWFCALIVSSLPVFWYGFGFLGSIWMTPEYSHGPLIPLISLYLFLRELRDISPDKVAEAAGKPPRRWIGVCIIGLGLFLGVAGNVTQIPDVTTYGMIVWTSGLVLTVFGWPRGRLHQLPVLHLIFMLALPGVIQWKLSIFLQGVSSEIGVAMVRAMGIPVYLNGNIIDLGVYQLHVAEACSGLRYLFPILSFSYLTAILYKGPMWHKFVLFFAAAPLAVMMNSFRIGMIGIMVNYRGIEAAEGFLHYFEGWVIFLLCIGVLFAMAVGLQRLTRDPKPLSEAIDLDFHGLPAEAMRIKSIQPSRELIMATLVSAVVSFAFLVTPPRIVDLPDRSSFSTFPTRFDGWAGMSRRLDEGVEAALKADDYVEINYLPSNGKEPVNFFSAWYARQTDNSGIHSPEVCLPGSGWEMFRIGKHTVDMPGTVYGTFDLHRAIIQRGVDKQLVYYWFEQRGTRMTNDFLAKLDVLVDNVVLGRSDGALVRFVTPITRDDGVDAVAAADERILEMMRNILPTLPEYLPE